MSGAFHRVSQYVSHGNGIVVFAEYHTEVAGRIHFRAFSVSPEAEFVVIPGVAI